VLSSAHILLIFPVFNMTVLNKESW
jgi:hypothetical protein